MSNLEPGLVPAETWRNEFRFAVTLRSPELDTGVTSVYAHTAIWKLDNLFVLSHVCGLLLKKVHYQHAQIKTCLKSIAF